MRKLNKREKIIGVLCLMFCLFFVGKQIILTRFIDYQDELETRIKVVSRKIAQAKLIVRNQDFYEGRLKDLANKVGVISSEGTEVARGASRMEEVARQVGVRIVNVQPKAAREEKYFNVYSLEVVLEGEWKGAARFIQLFQASDISLNINELRLEKYSQEATALRGRLVLNWIRFKPQPSR
jgi:hypothetical protein